MSNMLKRKTTKAPAAKASGRKTEEFTYSDVMSLATVKKNCVYQCTRHRPNGETKEDREADLMRNRDREMDACRFAASCGVIPICPQLYFCFLDEESESERTLGMNMGKMLLRMCSSLWIWGYHGPDSLSEGMRSELRFCKTHAIPVKCFPEPEEFDALMKQKTAGMEPKEAYRYLVCIIEESVYVPGAAEAPVYRLISEKAEGESDG